MNMHPIAKYNQNNAEGAPFPSVLPIAHYFLAVSEQVKSADEMGLILLMWLTNQYNWLTDDIALPPFILISNEVQFSRRIDSEKTDPKNETQLKIVESNVNWVEFSIQRKVLKEEYIFWIPIPTVFNQIIWESIRHSARDKCPFNKATITNVRNIFKSKRRAIDELKQTQIATFHQWKFYLTKSIKRDEELPKASRNVMLGEHNQYSESTLHYIEGSSLALRTATFKAYERYINPIFEGIKKFELTRYLIYPSLKGLKPIPINISDTRADYLNHQTIIEHSKKTHDDRTLTRLTKQKVKFGASVIPDSLDVCRVFNVLSSNTIKLQRQCNKRVPRATHEEYHNQLTLSFALMLVALTGIRPTHAIGPSFEKIGKQRFVIKDKGIAREVALTNFLHQEFQNYLLHINQMKQIFPSLKKIKTFALLQKGKPTILTAKKLRHFTYALTEEFAKRKSKIPKYLKGYVPYFYRRSFANTLSKLGTPNHILDHLMGHYTFGEQAGYSTERNHSQQINLLEKIEKEFGAKSLFKVDKNEI